MADLAPLPASFFDRPAPRVARALLGCVIESSIGGLDVAAVIVETEAYAGEVDEASHGHSRFGITPRNSVMYGPPARAYVYRSYGVHWCLNAVTDREGTASAVLIRAARPLKGIDVLRQRRPGRPDRDILRGPGNLARALCVDGSLNDHPLDQAPLRFLSGNAVPDEQVAVGPRIGISRSMELPYRFWVAGDPHVSRSSRRPGDRPSPMP